MGSKLDSSENEAVERSFGVRFLGGGTSYVQTPGELYIRGKSKPPPLKRHTYSRVVEIVVWRALQAVEVADPLNEYTRALHIRDHH